MSFNNLEEDAGQHANQSVNQWPDSDHATLDSHHMKTTVNADAWSGGGPRLSSTDAQLEQLLALLHLLQNRYNYLKQSRHL